MKRRAVLGLGLGVALFILVVATHDMKAVSGAFAAAGWPLIWVLSWRIFSIFASGAAWYSLFQRDIRPAYLFLILGRWISEAINHLLPVLQVGGDVVRARLAYLWGRHRGLAVPGVSIAAIQIIDVTCALSAQITLVSIGFLQLWYRGTLTLPVSLFGIVLILVPLVLLLAVQRRAILRGATNLAARFGLQRFLPSGEDAGETLAAAFRSLYAQHRRIAIAYLWHICAGLLRVGETWSALWFFGHPVSLADAMLVDIMTGAVRSLAFFIPGALGAQESGILLICSVVGIDPGLALALALAKRARDIILGLPGLASWPIVERFLIARQNESRPSAG
jgi:putative membrane protein